MSYTIRFNQMNNVYILITIPSRMLNNNQLKSGKANVPVVFMTFMAIGT